MPSHLDEVDLSWLLSIPDPRATDVPDMDATAQEHCLWLYFSNQVSSGMEMNIARFYERLISSDPLDRPHPALLNAMFLSVCQASPLEHIRAREESFFEKGDFALKEAIKDSASLPGNMLDLMRAAALMAEWLWGQSRKAEAVLMTSTACRIVLSAGFEHISSSTDLGGPRRELLLRTRNPICLPARDYIEIADRIYAFWDVIMLDLAASIAFGLPANIDLAQIRTPLPRPWPEYGPDPPSPDVYVSDLFKATIAQEDHYSRAHFVYIIQATILLYYSTFQNISSRYPSSWHEHHLPPLPPRRFTSHFASSPTPSSLTTANSSSSTFDLNSVVERFASSLPKELKSFEPATSDPLKAATVFMMQTILSATRMYLADTNDYESPNDAALYQARRIVDLMRITNANGALPPSLSLFILWTLACKILIREVKRLTQLGENIATIPLDADIDQLFQTFSVAAQKAPLVASVFQVLQMIRATPVSGFEQFSPGEEESPTSRSESTHVQASGEESQVPSEGNI